jgi:hypothetical protein
MARQANQRLASSLADIHHGMSRDRLDPPPARARAVADAPAEALAARAEELAHSWALTLLAARPLAEMTAIPLEDLARYAPAVCASLARALSSDEELAIFDLDAREREGRGGELAATAGLSALAAGWEASAAVGHVEALRGLLWKAALEELRDPTTRQVADLSDRLASVCAAALAYALSGRADARGAAAPGRPAFQPPREQVLYSSPAPSSGRGGAVLIDELDDAPRQARPRAAWRRGDGAPAPASAREQARPAQPPGPHGALGGSASRTAPRPLPWDTPLQSSAASTHEPALDAGSPAPDDPVMRVSRGPGTPADRRS